MATRQELAVQLAKDPQFKRLSPDRQKAVFESAVTRAQPTPSAAPQESFFQSQASKQLFRGGGQFIGGLAGGALGVGAGAVGGAGVASLPAAAAGGVLGARAGGILGGVAGEATRQAGLGLEGIFTGRSTSGMTPLQQIEQLGQAGMEAAIGESILPGLAPVARPLGRGLASLGRLFTSPLPEGALQYAIGRIKEGVNIFENKALGTRQALFGAMGKVQDAVRTVQKNPRALQPPGDEQLIPIGQQLGEAFDVARTNIATQFGQADQAALSKPLLSSLNKSGKVLKDELLGAGLIDAKGNPIAFGTARQFTAEESTLLNVFQDLKGMSPRPTEGLPGTVKAGIFIPYQQAKRLLARFDEAIGAVRTRNAKRILTTSRKAVVDGIKDSDKELERLFPAYKGFSDIRDIAEGGAGNVDAAIRLLKQAMRADRPELRQQLQQLDGLVPDDQKFMPALQLFQEATERVKLLKQAPQTVNRLTRGLKTDQEVETLVTNIFTAQESTLAQLEALDSVSPFLQEIRDVAVFRLFNSPRPSGFSLGLAGGAGAVTGAMGFLSGGRETAMATGTLGFLLGASASTPKTQAALLTRGVPALRGLQGFGRAVAPTVPTAGASLTRLLGGSQ